MCTHTYVRMRARSAEYGHFAAVHPYCWVGYSKFKSNRATKQQNSSFFVCFYYRSLVPATEWLFCDLGIILISIGTVLIDRLSRWVSFTGLYIGYGTRFFFLMFICAKFEVYSFNLSSVTLKALGHKEGSSKNGSLYFVSCVQRKRIIISTTLLSCRAIYMSILLSVVYIATAEMFSGPQMLYQISIDWQPVFSK